MVGEQFDVGNEVCGIVISIRFTEDIISVWNRNAESTEAKKRIAYVPPTRCDASSFVEKAERHRWGVCGAHVAATPFGVY
jgi:hypothetical protein